MCVPAPAGLTTAWTACATVAVSGGSTARPNMSSHGGRTASYTRNANVLERWPTDGARNLSPERGRGIEWDKVRETEKREKESERENHREREREREREERKAKESKHY